MGMLPLFAKDKMPAKRPLSKSENIILFGFSAIDYDGWIVMPAIVAKQDTERTQDSAIRQSVEYIGGLIERFRK